MASGAPLRPPSAAGRPRTLSRGERGLLIAVLAVAALLRFTHLGAGLQHTPHMDERYFVEAVSRMLEQHTLDPGWYEYPGLLYYLLAPVLALAGVSDPPDATAYLAARAFIATCGVLAVGLSFAFVRTALGSRPALFAAALLAVSPVHVQTAHTLRPDVVLECLMLLLFLALWRLDGSPQADALAGLALGLAVGVKFSGALGLVPTVMARWLVPYRRWRGLAHIAAFAALAFAVCSPYLLKSAGEAVSGLITQLTYHYQEQPSAPEPYASKLLAYASVWPKALGWPALALVGAGLLMARESWRKLLPYVVLPPLTASVFATTGYFFNRHMLPSMGVLALLAAWSWQRVPRSRGSAFGVALIALALPLSGTLSYLAGIGRPSTRDRAAAWALREFNSPARVLSTVAGLELDPQRFELLEPARLDAGAPLLLGEVQAAFSVESDEPALRAWPLAATIARVDPTTEWEGREIHVRRLAPSSALRPIDLAQAQLAASQASADLELLRDGRLDTYWSLHAGRGELDFVELRFPSEVLVTRIELLLGERDKDAGRGLELELSTDGVAFGRVSSWSGRPPTRAQLAALGGKSEVLLVQPARVRGLRIVRRAGQRRWSIAELRAWAPAP